MKARCGGRLCHLAVLALPSLAAVAQTSPAPATRRLCVRVLDADGLPLEGAGIAFGAPGALTTADALHKPLARSARDGQLDCPLPATALHAVLAARHHLAVEIAFAAGREAVDLGTLCLYPGAVLRGRVRGRDGEPIAGARISSSMPYARLEVPGASLRYCTTATSSAGGIYSLECAGTGPCRVVVGKDGYYSTLLFPVFADTPASPILDASGYVTGRVVDAEADCRTVLYGDAPGALDAGQASGNGDFRLPVASRGPLRLQLWGTSLLDEVKLAGPTAGVELRGARTSLQVRATADGKPVPNFRVQASWGGLGSAGWAWNQHFPQPLRGTDSRDGIAVVPRPAADREGLLRVEAEGMALARADVHADVDTVDLVLQPETSVEGTIVGEQRQPLAGARVFLQGLPPPGRQVSGVYAMPGAPAVAAADGSFRIGGLPAGRYALVAERDDFAVAEPQVLELAAGRHLQLPPLALRRLVSLRGRLQGSVPPGAMVDRATPQERSGSRGFRHWRRQRSGPAAVGADGSFALRDLPQEPVDLALLLPPSHPRGQRIELPLGRFLPGPHLQSIGVDELAPARLRGCVVGFDGALLRTWQVVVLRNGADDFFLPMAYADVDAGGNFAVRLPPGEFAVGLIDVRTGNVLHRQQEVVALASGQQQEIELAPQLQPVALALPRAEAAMVGSLVVAPANEGQGRFDRLFLLLMRDSLGTLPIAEGERELRCWLPAGSYEATLQLHPARRPQPGEQSLRGATQFVVEQQPVQDAFVVTPIELPAK